MRSEQVGTAAMWGRLYKLINHPPNAESDIQCCQLQQDQESVQRRHESTSQVHLQAKLVGVQLKHLGAKIHI